MGKIYVIANQKGGVAKTATAEALAAGFTDRGFKTLAIDMDPQTDLTDNTGFGYDPEQIMQLLLDDESKESEYPTIYDVMKGSSTAAQAIQHLDEFDLIPGDISLASADMEFTQTGREYKLKKALSPIKDSYDYIFIDTPPALGILTVNAFMAADSVIIPVSGTNSVKGIRNLAKTISVMREYGNPDLKIAGFLLTMFNPRANVFKMFRNVLEEYAKRLDTKVYDSFIRKSVIVDEAAAMTTDIFEYDAKNNVSVDYNNMIDEIIKEG